MGFFKWLYRLPGRFDRSLEQTAVVSSAVDGESWGGTAMTPGAVGAVRAEIEDSARRDEDSADATGG